MCLAINVTNVLDFITASVFEISTIKHVYYICFDTQKKYVLEIRRAISPVRQLL